MANRRLRPLWLLTLTSLPLPTPLEAQGSFVNFELPSVRPIDVAQVGGNWYVLVCNAANGTVEIYRSSDNCFVQSVPVGQHPATVRWNAAQGAFYTCNWLGDSVTRVTLMPGSGSTPLQVAVTGAQHVGDEPADIAFVSIAGTEQALVTLNSQSALQRINPVTLAPIGTPILLGVRAPAPKVLKEPRRIVVNGSDVFVLGTRGGPDGSSVYDCDLVGMSVTGSTLAPVASIGGLGTSTFSLQRSSNGRLWVVGNQAQWKTPGFDALRNEPTGFVQSQLMVLDASPLGANLQTRDLNRTALNQVVTPDRAISMPTDLAVHEVDGVPQKVFVASFCSNRIAVVDVTPSAASAWTIGTNLLTVPSGLDYKMVGPRSFAMKPADGTGPARLYVGNTLMPSFTVIDPNSPLNPPTTVLLQTDPTPTLIRQGRRGLYDASISARGFVACASCHLDGGTDGLVWFLEPGSFVGPDPSIPVGLLGDSGNPLSTFPVDKDGMVTQNLHGLVNHTVPGSAHALFSNQPYHWRGDRADFLAFNSAFFLLMGGNELSPQEMTLFRDFINTCVYSPNPEQPLDRRVSGGFGDPNGMDGTETARGQKLFHTLPLDGARFRNRSCVHCHSGASGSNNRITEVDDRPTEDPGIPMFTPPPGAEQPIETAAIRSLVSREAEIPGSSPTIRTGAFGLLHPGATGARSIDHFVASSFGQFFTSQSALADVIAFTRTFDAGVAPIVGRTLSVDLGNVGGAPVADALTLAEQQVLDANAGLVVHSHEGANSEGYWFDVTVAPPVYRREGSSVSLSRQSLLALVTATRRLVVQSTPLGSERRMASSSGTAAILTGSAPSGVVLEALLPPTHWTNVDQLTSNAEPDFPGSPLPRSVASLLVMQDRLVVDARVKQRKHEPVRRFTVTGNDIRPGAVLTISNSWTPPISVPLFPTGLTAGTPARQVWQSTVEIDPMLLYQLMHGGPGQPAVQSVMSNPTVPVTFLAPAQTTFQIDLRNEDNTTNAADASMQIVRVPL
jgi:DNA-binding beta-propeller fold protein YncE